MEKILIIGNGAREDCILWKPDQSDKVFKIYVAPGNASTAKKSIYFIYLQIPNNIYVFY